MDSDAGSRNAGDQMETAADDQDPQRRTDESSSAVHQPPLPLPWRLNRPRGEADFAHPAEVDFASILTYYRVRWAYEPTTFALAWADDGQPSEMFTPDFYLPDHRLYIELTTMRQRLVTRKNRKLRRLRELYPTVRVKLLYRRDYHRLLDSYHADKGPRSTCHIGRVLFGEEQIRTRVAELADELAPVIASAANEPLALTIGAGARRFADTMVREIGARGVPLEREAIRLSRFSTGGRHRVRVSRGPRAPLAGRHVVLFTDIVSTGLSLSYLCGWLRRRGVARIEVCTLLDRREARLVDLPHVYAGFEAPNELLIGFGLHLRSQFRDLPHIATLAVDGPP
ncbi:MAG: phosphoribosyltransferase [Thermomicrobiales bacterium]